MATKVFVGNLAFATTTETLKTEFSAAGEVLNANIITRGPRSLGYGFVELASPEAADKAVTLLHHKELDGRTINVEVARPRAEGEGDRSEEGADGDRPRRRRQRKPRTDEEGEGSSAGTSGDNGSTSSRPAGGRGGRRRYSRQDGQEGGSGDEQPRRFRRTPAGEGADATQQGEGAPRRGGRGRGGRSATAARTTFQPKSYRKVGEGSPAGGSEAGPSSPSAPRTRKPRQPRQPVKRQEDRLPSETTLFVANLPFATTDEQLKALFSTAAPVASAHVVTRKNGKSKGFGFVEFATKEHQEAALKATDGSEVEGRKLNVKVALKAPPTDGAGASGSTGDAAPSASTSEAKPAEPAKTDAKPADAGEKDKTTA